MIRTSIYRASVLILFCALTPANAQKAETDGASTKQYCSFIAQVLKDYSTLKVGSKRSDVERFFTEEAGPSFGDQVPYVYKKCHYITLMVTYAAQKAGSKSASDIVNSLSKLSIGYELKD